MGIDTVLAPETWEPALGNVAAVAVSESGNIALLDGMAKEVWVRPDPHKPWVRVAGRGDGPAELRSATGAWWVGDTLTIFDAGRSRLLRFAEGMTPIGTGVPLPRTQESGFRGVPYGDGTGFLAVLTAYPDIRLTEGAQRPELAVIWVPVATGSAEPPDTIGRWPGRVWAIPPMGGIAVQPFGADTHIDASARGIAVADGSLPRAWVLGFDGEVQTEIRWEETVDPVSDKLAGFLETYLEDVPTQAQPRSRALLESLPYPESLPYTGGVVMGFDEVWLAEWFGTEVEYRGRTWPATEWRAVHFGPEPGVERITIPPGILPLDILSRDAVVVLLKDDLGRQGVGIARMEERQSLND